LVSFVAAHGDAFELFEFAEEILDEMAPFVNLGIDAERRDAPWMLGDHDLRPTFVHVGDDPVRIESLVGYEPAKFDPGNQRRDAHRIEALTGQ